MTRAAFPVWICPVCRREFARKSQMHSCKVTSLETHLAKASPETRRIYEAVEKFLRGIGRLSIVPTKTGVSLLSRTLLGGVSIRKDYLYIGFILTREIEDRRFLRAERGSRRTYVYRIQLRTLADFDDKVRAWLREAHEVGMMAGRRWTRRDQTVRRRRTKSTAEVNSMKKLATSAFVFAAVLLCACSTRQDQLPKGEWIDLSHDLSSETLYWPTAEPFKLETVSAGMTEKGYYYSAYKFSAAEHGGTHIDAPVHFAEGRNPVDRIPLTQLIASAIKVDVTAKASGDRDYQISTSDFESWESRHGRIPEGAIVLVETGWGRYWPDRLKYLGTERLGPEAVAELHFPGLAPEAAQWLTENRSIGAIGLDTPSIDYGQSQLFESHRILMARDIPALENVANLDRLPATGAMVVALPMKIRGGSGAPLRVVALLPTPR
ncbi:MAG TPA: cyclase family protein [Blastocatellia bacterium]|nr:cyclase family protein [Blastocatellia bacterium]